jgi:hypothetical protein
LTGLNVWQRLQRESPADVVFRFQLVGEGDELFHLRQKGFQGLGYLAIPLLQSLEKGLQLGRELLIVQIKKIAALQHSLDLVQIQHGKISEFKFYFRLCPKKDNSSSG